MATRVVPHAFNVTLGTLLHVTAQRSVGFTALDTCRPLLLPLLFHNRAAEQNRIRTTRGLLILVAPVTAKEHKGIFLLCYYFARRKKRIPPIHRQNPAARTTVGQTIREEILEGLLTGQRWALAGFLAIMNGQEKRHGLAKTPYHSIRSVTLPRIRFFIA